jgi:DNA-binding NarL/FixJ family response regulator
MLMDRAVREIKMSQSQAVPTQPPTLGLNNDHAFLSVKNPIAARSVPAWPAHFQGQAARPIRVLLVDDDSHVRKCIADELLADPRVQLVAQGAGLKEGRHLVAKHEFDVLLVDLNLGDGLGFDLIRLVKSTKPLVEAVLISVIEDEDHALHAFSLGATGYYVKHSWFGNFPEAVLQVANGGASITPSLARRLLKQMTGSPRSQHARQMTDVGSGGADPIEVLSEREREVLKLVAMGYISTEVSKKLTISVQTVNTHIKNIHRKLNVRTRAQAVNLASNSGLI